MSKKRTVYIGPSRILTAPRITDVFGNWTDLGLTRGEVVVTIHSGNIAMGTTDQTGSTPLANSIYYLGGGVDITLPFADDSIEKLLTVAPQSVKKVDGVLENLGFGSIPNYVEERAFCLVPEFVYREGTLDAILKSEFVHWLRNGYVTVTGDFIYGLPEGGDVIGDRSIECELKQTQEIGIQNAGLGRGYLLDMDVMGVSNSTQLSAVVTEAGFVTLLNGAGISTIKQLTQNTGALTLGAGNITDAKGLEYAVRTTSIDISGRNVASIPSFEGFGQLTNFNMSTNSIPADQLNAFIKDMWDVRVELGTNTATLNVSGNGALSQESIDRINGTGGFVGEGLSNYGVTVTY